MEILIYVMLALNVVLLVGQIVLWVVVAKKMGNPQKFAADKITIKNDVRYSTAKNVVDTNGNAKITHLPKDIILQANQTYTVAKKGKIMPGQYTVLSADEAADSFTLKVGGVVKQYQHNSALVLAEGDEISPRSGSVILR